MIFYLLGILRKRGREARRESQDQRAPIWRRPLSVAGH